MCKTFIKNNEKPFSIMSNLQTHYHFKLDLQKWVIQGTKHRTDNHFTCKASNSP